MEDLHVGCKLASELAVCGIQVDEESLVEDDYPHIHWEVNQITDSQNHTRDMGHSSSGWFAHASQEMFGFGSWNKWSCRMP